jgi:bifunctional NMN adenylyltransferase/nudix hydrolase
MKMTVKNDAENADVGVIIGRFQVHELHDAHRAMIQYVCDRHDKVLVVLGLSLLVGTQNNPLDLEARRQMIMEAFPQVNLAYIKDIPGNDRNWSKRLDNIVSDFLSPSQTAVLYGGRDSFMEHYLGAYNALELVQDTWVSGSEIRKNIAKRSTKGTADFRAGAIWSSSNHFPTAYRTVDVAIFDGPGKRILLGRKSNEIHYRFIGGFTDPRCESDEQDAMREVQEELGIEIGGLTYVGNYAINDPRYAGEVDSIRTTLFTATYQFGIASPNDDLEEARWFDWPLEEHNIMPLHRPLLRALQTKIQKKV